MLYVSINEECQIQGIDLDKRNRHSFKRLVHIYVVLKIYKVALRVNDKGTMLASYYVLASSQLLSIKSNNFGKYFISS